MTESRKIKPTACGECDFLEDESYADLNQIPNCNTLNIWGFKKEENQTGKNSASDGDVNDTYIISWKQLQTISDCNI